MFSIFFTKECFGKDFFDLPDMEEVSELISQSDKGIFLSSNLEKIKILMLEFGQASKFEWFQLFMRILDTINNSEKKQLYSFLYNKELTLNEGRRMSSVFDYLIKNV